MDSDDQPSITDPADAAWISDQRRRVNEYLTSQNVEHSGVSLEPRWFLSPYVAVWAVRSKANPDLVGWWAISGDLPTDYLTCHHESNNAEVLRSFSRQWKAAAVRMEQGDNLPGYQIGPVGHEKELAPLLLRRAQLLADFAAELDVEDADGQR
jgi:hypothetical protein